MDTDFIAKVIIAAGSALGLLVMAVVKFFVNREDARKKKMRSTPPPPPPRLRAVPEPLPPTSNPEFASLAHSVRSIEKSIDTLHRILQEREKSDAKDGVHAAETRRLIADMASAMQALVIQIEHDRVGWRRESDDTRSALRDIREHLRDLTSDLRRLGNSPQ